MTSEVSAQGDVEAGVRCCGDLRIHSVARQVLSTQARGGKGRGLERGRAVGGARLTRRKLSGVRRRR